MDLRVFAACLMVGAAHAASIQGRIFSHDGTAMPHAALRYGYPQGTFLGEAVANSDGSFEFSPAKPGLYVLQFAGVQHQPRTRAAVYWTGNSDVRVDVTLGTPEYSEAPASVEIVPLKSGPGPRQKAARGEDGNYSVEFETTDSEVAYFVNGFTVRGGPIDGTQADSYRLVWMLPGGSYRAVVRSVGGKVRIVFDPRLLPPGGRQGRVEVSSADSAVAAVNASYQEIFARDRDVALRAHPLGLPAGDSNSIVRQAQWINWLDASGPKRQVSAKSIKEALAQLPAESVLWWLRPELAYDAVRAIDVGSESFFEVATNLPDNQSKAACLIAFATAANAAGRKDDVQAVLVRLNEGFPDASQTKVANDKFGIKKAVVGNSSPAFSFAALGEPGRKYTLEDFKGKIVLIDFWATWCAPCVAEMENLHKAYTMFAPKGFEILSYSLDKDAEAAGRFRRGRWPMPWQHAFDQSVKHPQYATFGMYQLPAPVLLDGNGVVLAVGDELMGDGLFAKLKSVFEK